MVIINAPLRADLFKTLAEEAGLKFVSKTGMKMLFENPDGNDAERAAELKQQFKVNKDLAAVFFQVTTD